MSFWDLPVMRNISSFIWGPAHPRMAEDIEDCTQVKTITARQLGMKIVEKCGNEGQWPLNTAEQRRARMLLQAAISYIPKAYQETGVDLSNATFYFSIPGCEFAVKAGKGIWEIQFSFNLNDQIECQCSNCPKYKWLWNLIERNWERVIAALGIVAAAAPQAIKYYKS